MYIQKFCRIEFLYSCASHGHNLGTTYCTCFEDPEAKNEEKIGKIEAVCMTTICDSKAAAHTTVAAHISTLMLVEYQCSAVKS